MRQQPQIKRKFIARKVTFMLVSELVDETQLAEHAKWLDNCIEAMDEEAGSSTSTYFVQDDSPLVQFETEVPDVTQGDVTDEDWNKWNEVLNQKMEDILNGKLK